MKLPQTDLWKRPGPPRPDKRDRGVASIVVLVVLLILAALLVANARVLAGLKAEILLLEKKQLRKYAVPPVAATSPEPQPVPAREPADR